MHSFICCTPFEHPNHEWTQLPFESIMVKVCFLLCNVWNNELGMGFFGDFLCDNNFKS
jgi:hypothetical protein